MKEIPKPEKLRKKGGFWVQIGNHQLHIGILDPFFPSTKAHPAFQVENIRKYLEVNLVETVDEDDLEGAQRFYVYDPFGNRIEFIEWHKMGGSS